MAGNRHSGVGAAAVQKASDSAHEPTGFQPIYGDRTGSQESPENHCSHSGTPQILAGRAVLASDGAAEREEARKSDKDENDAGVQGEMTPAPRNVIPCDLTGI